jgi:aspartyl-tRNA(Asn)/glutamyl-tRNA(Gln) amidotransferase subunit A
MARSARDIALILSVIEGPDGYDHYALPVPPSVFPDLSESISARRIGYYVDGPVSPVATEVQAAVHAAAESLAGLGCIVEEVDLPFMREVDSLAVSGAIAASEGVRDLEPLIDGRSQDLAPSMQRRLSLPRPTHQDHLEALAIRESLRTNFKAFFANFDLLLCPATAVPAPPHGSIELDVDGQMTPGRTALMCTAVFDMTGAPAISIPFGWSNNGLPIGVQLVSRHFDESTLVHSAATLAAAGGATDSRPPLN